MQSPYGDECINGFLYSLQTEKSVEMVFYAVSIRRRLHLCIFYLFSIWRRLYLCIFCVFPELGKDVKCIWVVRNGRGQLFLGVLVDYLLLWSTVPELKCAVNLHS